MHIVNLMSVMSVHVTEQQTPKRNNDRQRTNNTAAVAAAAAHHVPAGNTRTPQQQHTEVRQRALPTNYATVSIIFVVDRFCAYRERTTHTQTAAAAVGALEIPKAYASTGSGRCCTRKATVSHRHRKKRYANYVAQKRATATAAAVAAVAAAD